MHGRLDCDLATKDEAHQWLIRLCGTSKLALRLSLDLQQSRSPNIPRSHHGHKDNNRQVFWE